MTDESDKEGIRPSGRRRRSLDKIHTISGLQSPLTEEDKDRIVELRAEGKSTSEIMRMYGRRKDTILRVFKERKVKLSKGRPHTEIPSDEEVYRVYKEGNLTVEDLSEHYGRSPAVIEKILERMIRLEAKETKAREVLEKKKAREEEAKRRAEEKEKERKRIALKKQKAAKKKEEALKRKEERARHAEAKKSDKK